MRAIGIDWGEKFVGIAFYDDRDKVIVPLAPAPSGEALDEIVRICEERGVDLIFLGFPVTLNGELSRVSREVLNFKESLETLLKERGFKLEVRLVDERFSSKFIESVFSAGKAGGQGRRTRRKRSRKDQRAWRRLKHSYEAMDILSRGLRDYLREQG